MRFYDREREIDILRKFKRIAVIGRRRVGKTRLVEETFKDNCITLFVSQKKTEKLICEDWVKEVREKGIYIPDLEKMKDIVEYLLRNTNKVIFIDEFQNILKVNPSFLWDLQRLLDKYRERKFIVAGSLFSMTKKLLFDSRSPVYGRFDFVLKLKELSLKSCLEIFKDFGRGLEECFEFYSVFGGIPKYYETFEKFDGSVFEFVKAMFFEDPYPYLLEVELMLIEEFGKEYKNYFSILEAVSNGYNTLGEIAGYVGRKSNEITKYIKDLRETYEYIRERRVIGIKKKYYEISQNLIEFWFRFAWKNKEKIERGEYCFKKDVFEKYVGKKFEDFVRENSRKIFGIECKEAVVFERKNGKRVKKQIDLVSDEFIGEIKWSFLKKKDIEKIRNSLEDYKKIFNVDRIIIVCKDCERKDEDILTFRDIVQRI